MIRSQQSLRRRLREVANGMGLVDGRSASSNPLPEMTVAS